MPLWPPNKLHQGASFFRNPIAIHRPFAESAQHPSSIHQASTSHPPAIQQRSARPVIHRLGCSLGGEAYFLGGGAVLGRQAQAGKKPL